MTWKSLRHPNVLPLLGVMMTENRFVMISEWMENGRINEYVRVHGDVDRLKLVRLPLRTLFLFNIDDRVRSVAERRY